MLEARIEWFVAGQIWQQNESFEKPGCMRQMPFRGAGIGHRLEHLILGRQPGRDSHAGFANGSEPVAKRVIPAGSDVAG